MLFINWGILCNYSCFFSTIGFSNSNTLIKCLRSLFHSWKFSRSLIFTISHSDSCNYDQKKILFCWHSVKVSTRMIQNWSSRLSISIGFSLNKENWFQLQCNSLLKWLMIEFIIFVSFVNKSLFLSLLFVCFFSNSNTFIKLLIIKCVSFLKVFIFFLQFWWLFFNYVQNFSEDDWKFIFSFVRFYKISSYTFWGLWVCYIW